MKRLFSTALAIGAVVATSAYGTTLEAPTGTRINKYGMEVPTFDANNGVCHDRGIVVNEENCLIFDKYGEARLPTYLRPRPGREYETALLEFYETGSYNHLGRKAPPLTPPPTVPLPAAFWMLLASVFGLFVIRKKVL